MVLMEVVSPVRQDQVRGYLGAELGHVVLDFSPQIGKEGFLEVGYPHVHPPGGFQESIGAISGFLCTRTRGR